jgi:hypothetical protein
MSSLEDGKLGEPKPAPAKIANPAPLGMFLNSLILNP